LQEALKDLLGDTIQNMLEAELDEHLGYEKYESTEEAKSNYRNGPRTGMQNSSRKLFPGIKGTFQKLKIK